jgi:glycosyltransferase involved in cell wall biosynthesis
MLLKMTSNRRSICFVGADNYPVLNSEYKGHYIGGESVQQTLLAKAFVDLGYDVSMVVIDLGQPDAELIEGIRVFKTFRPHAGVPVFRFIHPRFTGMWQALKRANADIYYQSCASVATGFVAWFCRKYDRKFVFRVAHDTDLMPAQQLIPYWRDKKIYEYGLRQADLIINQSQQQQDLLRENYHLEGPALNMVVQLPAQGEMLSRDIDVLWVNNLRPFKRPEKVLELAVRLPDLRIVMIGGPCHGHEALYEEIRRRAQDISNLEFKGHVPYQEVNSYYSRSRVFVNTSDSEGFPNSFLQAWVRGTPVISFFDPDGIIVREGLGDSPDGVDQMVAAVKELDENDDRLAALSAHVSAFAHDHYSPEAVAIRYHKLFQNLSDSGC